VSRSRQSKADRIQRLSRDCCPIHGIELVPTGTARVSSGELDLAQECPRLTCHVAVWFSPKNGNTVFCPPELEGLHSPPNTTVLDLLAAATEDSDE